MADAEELLAGIVPTIFGGNTGLTQEQLKRRQAIAVAMAAQKKGYPRNLGEGLTSLGEGIGARLYENRLVEAEKDLDARRMAALRGPTAAPTLPATGIPPSVSGRLGLGGPVPPGTVPPGAGGLGAAPPPPGAPGPTAAGEPEDDEKDVATRLALALMEDKAPGGAQPNPMVAAGPSAVPAGPDQPVRYAALNTGTMSDATGSPAPAGSPAPLDENEPTPTDILPAPTRVAGAATLAGSPAPPPAAAGAPAPSPAPATGISGPLTPTTPPSPTPEQPELPPGMSITDVPEKYRQPPTFPTAPKMPPPNALELKGIDLSQRWAGDEFMQDQAKQLVTRGQQLRTDEHARQIKEYDAKVDEWKQASLQWQTFWRELPKFYSELQKNRAEATKSGAETNLKRQEFLNKEQEEKIKTQLGGLTSSEFQTQVLKPSTEKVVSIPSASMATQRAREILNSKDGIFYGPTAKAELYWAKIRERGGVPDPRIANTETFLTTMAPIIASVRSALVGNQMISTADIQLGERMSGGDIGLDKKTMLSTLDAIDKGNLFAAIEHQKKLARYSGNDPARVDTAYNNFGLPMERIIPQRTVDLLRKSIAEAGGDRTKIEATLRDFDQDFATPGLAQRVLNGRR